MNDGLYILITQQPNRVRGTLLVLNTYLMNEC